MLYMKRAGEDTRRAGVRFFRAYHRRQNGRLRRQFHEERWELCDTREGEQVRDDARA